MPSDAKPRVSGALLRLSQGMTSERTVGEIFQRAIETVPTIVPCVAAAAYTRDEETGAFRVARVFAVGAHTTKPRSELADIPKEIAEHFLFSETEPFVIPQEMAMQVPADSAIRRRPRRRPRHAAAMGCGRVRCDRRGGRAERGAVR